MESLNPMNIPVTEEQIRYYRENGFVQGGDALLHKVNWQNESGK